jgi:hypothetical protein
MSAMLAQPELCGSDVTISVILDDTEHLSRRPLTRSRRVLVPEEEVIASPHSPFIQEMIDAWVQQPAAKLASGQRKRVFSASRRTVSLKAHKAILVARSIYFKTLFNGPFRDGSLSTVEFRGPVDALVVMMRFLYCGMDEQLKGALRSDRDLCWRTLFVAHEYGIDGLQYHCEGVFVAELTGDQLDASSRLSQAAHYIDMTSTINVPFLKLVCADCGYINYYKHSTKKNRNSEAKALLENTGLAHLFPAALVK